MTLPSKTNHHLSHAKGIVNGLLGRVHCGLEQRINGLIMQHLKTYGRRLPGVYTSLVRCDPLYRDLVGRRKNARKMSPDG